MAADKTIPVLIDDVKTADRFVRCSYFCIQCDEPSPDWMLHVGNLHVQFLLVGLSGIIYEPLAGDRFRSTQDIDDLFNQIEELPALFVDINHLWLPQSLFRPGTLRRGALFRIPLPLFQRAFRFREKITNNEDFQAECRQLAHPEIAPTEETAAFAAWTKHHIDLARERVDKLGEQRLRWRKEFETKKPPRKTSRKTENHEHGPDETGQGD